MDNNQLIVLGKMDIEFNCAIVVEGILEGFPSVFCELLGMESTMCTSLEEQGIQIFD